jgi:hypothetical protein
LAQGQTCRKQDATVWWENDNSQRFLNPSACASVSSGFYWPVFLTGFFAFLVFGYACIMLGASFFLSDTSEFMEIYNKKVGLTEVIFFVLALVALIIALLFIGKLKSSAGAGYQEHPWATKNRLAEEGQFPDDPDYKVVNDSLSNVSASQSSDIEYDPATMPKAVAGSCTTGKCGFRVAILARNAKFDDEPSAPVLLDDSARYVFFPGCENSADDFIFLKGDQD